MSKRSKSTIDGDVMIQPETLKWVAEGVQKEFGQGDMRVTAGTHSDVYGIRVGGSFSDIQLSLNSECKVELDQDVDRHYNQSFDLIETKVKPFIQRLSFVGATIEACQDEGLFVDEISEITADQAIEVFCSAA